MLKNPILLINLIFSILILCCDMDLNRPGKMHGFEEWVASGGEVSVDPARFKKGRLHLPVEN